MPEKTDTCARRIDIVQFLQVIGKDQGRYAPLADGRAEGPIGQVTDLFGNHDGVDMMARHVLEHRHQVDLLLVMRAKRGVRLLPCNRQNRHMVGARIVKPGQKMRGPRGC